MTIPPNHRRTYGMRVPAITTVRLRLDVLEQRRIDAGLSLNALAAKADIDPRTLQRIKKLGYCRLDTARYLAQALGMRDCESLIDPPLHVPPRSSISAHKQMPAPQTSQGSWGVLYLPIPIDLLTSDSVQRVLQALSRLIENRGDIDEDQSDVRSLEIALRFELVEDVDRLVLAFCEGHLLACAIARIEVPISIDVPAVLASIGAETLESDLLLLAPRSRRLTIEAHRPEASPLCDHWRLEALVHSPNRDRETRRQGAEFRKEFFVRQWQTLVSSTASEDVSADV